MSSDKDSKSPRRRDRRYSWRDESHRQAHAQPQSQHPLPIAPHPLASSLPAEALSSQREIDDMLEHIRSAGEFAFDSEFIGERSYEPQLCLVQVATRQRVFVVDALAGWDLSGLWHTIVSPEAEKIVLAGQQDMIPPVLATHRPGLNITDVQVAAGFIHTEYPLSLARLAEKFVGVSLPKAHQFTHWDKRPLSALQVRYAGDDVRYLPAAHDAISRRLEELGRTDWAKQESQALLGDMTFYEPAPENLYLRVRGRDRLRRSQLAVLRELAIVRDQAAREQDVPPRTLLKDEILVAMARRPAKTVEDLDAIKGLPRPVELKYGSEIVAATTKALTLPQAKWPPPEFQEREVLHDRVAKAFDAIKQFCLDHSIASTLVASRKDVARLVQAADMGQSVKDSRLMQGWRKEFLGELLAKLIG